MYYQSLQSLVVILERVKELGLYVVKMQPETAVGLITAIKLHGYDAVLDAAYCRAVMERNEANRLMKLSRAMLAEARSGHTSPSVHNRFLLLSRFYRHLAHKIYWSLGDDGETQREFLQEI